MRSPLRVGQLRVWSHRMPTALLGKGTRDGLLFTVVDLSDSDGGIASILWEGGLEDDWVQDYLRENSVALEAEADAQPREKP